MAGKTCNRCSADNLHWETADDGRYKLYHGDDTLHICKGNDNNTNSSSKYRAKKTGGATSVYNSFKAETKQIEELFTAVKTLNTELDLMHDEITNLQTRFEEFTVDAK